MSSSPLTLALVSPEDLPFLGEVYYRSFLPTALFRYNWPGVDRSAFGPWLTARVQAALDGRAQGGKSDFLVAKLGEEVVGYASYTYFPQLSERVVGVKKKRLLPEGGTEQRAGGFLSKLDIAKAKDPAAHYSLDNLAVVPEAQGKGVGKALTVALIKQAEQEGVGLTLEATAGGMLVYSRLGFVITGDVLRGDEEPDTDILWPMAYRPVR